MHILFYGNMNASLESVRLFQNTSMLNPWGVSSPLLLSQLEFTHKVIMKFGHLRHWTFSYQGHRGPVVSRPYHNTNCQDLLLNFSTR